MEDNPNLIKGKSAKFAAQLFNYGNIIAVIVFPLIIFWFAASIVIYAMNRHHPIENVGYFTQWAAYRFYGVLGVVVVVATYYGSESLQHWLITWLVVVLIVVPWSIVDLLRIRKLDWPDQIIEDEDE